MKANELRIGNWVNIIKHVPTQITAAHIESIYNGDSDYSPIPLTPDILEKAGFKVTSKGFFTHPNWYNISLKYRDGTCQLRVNFMDVIATNFDYLHQLQNLYYALTGTELTINL